MVWFGVDLSTKAITVLDSANIWVQKWRQGQEFLGKNYVLRM